jgi:transposase
MPITIAVDLAKSIFEVAVSERPGRIREQHRLTRPQFERFIAMRPAATIVMEACATAHFWGRHAEAHGHRPILLPPHAVRPYVLRNKTDRSDAKGLLEALRNEAIHPVPVKTLPQQTLTALHRLRSTWLATRTARINTVRGLLREFGISIPLGARRVVPMLRDLLSDEHSAIPQPLRPALAAAADEIGDLEKRLAEVARQIVAVARQTPSIARLRTVPGIGLLIATSLVAFLGDPHRFPSGRHFASYLGLTPANPPAARTVVSVRSANEATPICPCFSCMERARSCGTPRRSNDPGLSNAGRFTSRGSAATTKPPSPISSLASPGRFGRMTSPSIIRSRSTTDSMPAHPRLLGDQRA